MLVMMPLPVDHKARYLRKPHTPTSVLRRRLMTSTAYFVSWLELALPFGRVASRFSTRKSINARTLAGILSRVGA